MERDRTVKRREDEKRGSLDKGGQEEEGEDKKEECGEK